MFTSKTKDVGISCNLLDAPSLEMVGHEASVAAEESILTEESESILEECEDPTFRESFFSFESDESMESEPG